MATNVYFLIRSAAECDHSRRAEWIRRLEAMPDVERVQRTLGEYDLLATVEGVARPQEMAERILANGCVEHLAVRYGPNHPAPT